MDNATKETPPAGLTRIHARIHCAATEDASEGTDIEAIQRKEFIRVLAEIAMAISKRKGNQCEQ